MEEVGGYEDLYPFLVEQNGFAFVGDELSAPAKVLKDYIKQHKKPQFKAAVIDGEYYNESQLDVLAAMKSKDEVRSEEHTSELQSRGHLVCRLLLEKKKSTN